MGIKLSFDFNRMRVDIEGEPGDIMEAFKAVKEIAPKFEEVRIFPPGKTPKDTDDPQGDSGDQGATIPPRDSGRNIPPTGLRDFTRRLNLDNQFIKIAAVAFHQREYGSKPTFSAKEMGDWFGLCGFQKPKFMAVAISDTARRKEYIKNIGRGQWSLTTIGENAVRLLLENGKH